METMTLAEFLGAVIYEASIDASGGAGGANSRHSPAQLTSLFNRTWSSLRALVSGNGMTQFLEEQTGSISAPAGGEDFSILAWPAAASEVHGVDVNTSGSFGWQDLDPIEWGSRRAVKVQPDRLGYWSVKKLPKENGAGIPADGEIAVFPGSFIAGLPYKMFYLPHWIPIASGNTTFLIIGYPDWFKWAINTMVMTITKRDTNKQDTFAAAKLQKDEAEIAIKKSAKRVQRQGKIIPMRRDGMDL